MSFEEVCKRGVKKRWRWEERHKIEGQNGKKN